MCNGKMDLNHLKKLNIHVQSFLDEFQVNCPKCKTGLMRYDELILHLKEKCNLVTLSCPNKCDITGSRKKI